MNEEQFKDACRLVENRCRALGKNCEVIFMPDGVQVAPPSWPGAAVGKTLHDAIKEAEKVEA